MSVIKDQKVHSYKCHDTAISEKGQQNTTIYCTLYYTEQQNLIAYIHFHFHLL